MFNHHLIYVCGSENSQKAVADFIKSKYRLDTNLLPYNKNIYSLYLVGSELSFRELTEIAKKCETSYLIYEKISKVSDEGTQFSVLHGELSGPIQLSASDVKCAKERLGLV